MALCLYNTVCIQVILFVYREKQVNGGLEVLRKEGGGGAGRKGVRVL